MSDPAIVLLNLLEDEFRDSPGVRVRILPKAGTRRSPDLEQDYDPDSSRVHARRGVMVSTRRHEFFVPAAFVEPGENAKLLALISDIRRDLD
jgi:hypothetical protein